jgi:hypothetical protein
VRRKCKQKGRKRKKRKGEGMGERKGEREREKNRPNVHQARTQNRKHWLEAVSILEKRSCEERREA